MATFIIITYTYLLPGRDAFHKFQISALEDVFIPNYAFISTMLIRLGPLG